MDTTYSTICSMLPYELVESKPGLNPNEFTIKKAEKGKFTLTIIPNNVFYLINPDPLSDAKDVRNIKVPVPSIEVAQSIIQDYINSLLAVQPPNAVPGLFAVAGDWKDYKEFALKHINEITFYRMAQTTWFQNLVAIADDFWSKTHSPASIGDIQRDACRELGYVRDWLNPTPSELQEKCPVCKNTVNTGALKCVSCGHIINKAEYDKLMLTTK